MQTDPLHLSGGGPAPPVAPHALRHGGAVPAAAEEEAAERPPQPLHHVLPRNRGGEIRKRALQRGGGKRIKKVYLNSR